MSRRKPQFLPILLVAVGGVLAVRALAGIEALPQAMAGAKAWAETLAPEAKPDKKAAKPDATVAAADPKPAIPPQAALVQPKPPPPPVCAPTPAELARQAGMSPAELQVLQSLGNRRTQLDAREQSMDTQLQLLAAAEAKVDGKLKQLAGLKGDIQGLLGQADAMKQSEMTRLVTVYEKMKPQDAAARMTLLDDSVRLPLASKMKISALSAVLAQMPPAEAKGITEKLADRLTTADKALQAIAAATTAAAAAPAATPAGAKPKKG
jgi:flagellar motility protein MotE (MotC chaperone)